MVSLPPFPSVFSSLLLLHLDILKLCFAWMGPSRQVAGVERQLLTYSLTLHLLFTSHVFGRLYIGRVLAAPLSPKGNHSDADSAADVNSGSTDTSDTSGT